MSEAFVAALTSIEASETTSDSEGDEMREEAELDGASLLLYIHTHTRAARGGGGSVVPALKTLHCGLLLGSIIPHKPPKKHRAKLYSFLLVLQSI